MTPAFDALIVGYGPTGATLANLLGRRGWRVAVVDRSTAVYDKPRAITADQEAMRVFQSIGLAEEIEPTTVPHPGTDFLGVEGQLIKQFYPAPPPPLLGWEPSFMFFQPQLEQILRAGVARFGNVEVGLGRELTGFTTAADSVLATVHDAATGEHETVRARYLLACDGASSRVRQQLDCRIEDLGFDEWWVVVDTLLTGEPDLPERVTHYCRPSRPGSYIVGPGSLRRWELKILPGENPSDFHSEANTRQALDEFVDTEQLDVVRIAVYRFHALVVDDWRKGRVFLLGDAAHQMPPFLGQGMGAGIRDAWNLAWKLDAVERAGVSGQLLDTYTAERKPHVSEVVAHAESFGRIIGETDAVRCAARDRRLSEELRSGTAETIRQRFIPGLSGGLISTAVERGERQAAAGELFPQPRVERPDGAVVLLDDCLGPGFALVLTDPELNPQLKQLDTETARKWADLGGRTICVHQGGPKAHDRAGGHGATHVRELESLLADWARQRSAAAMVVRPDRYVYGTAKDPAGLASLIRRLSGRLRGAPVTASAGEERKP